MVLTVGKSKYPCVLQLDESDCAAAAVATVSKYYGRTFTINRIREAVGTGQVGTTLLGLRRGAEVLGFNAQAARLSPQIINHKINEIPIPAIIHWKGYHYVVFYGQQRRHYVIADPAVGIRRLSKQELLAGWTDGIILLLTPDSRFFAQPNDNIGGLVRFFKRVLPYRSILIPTLLCALFTGLLSLTLPFLIQLLTDDVLVRGDTKLLNATIIAVGASFFCKNIKRLADH